MEGVEREYEYRPGRTMIVLFVFMALAFGLFAVLLDCKAAGDEHCPAALNYVIKSSPDWVFPKLPPGDSTWVYALSLAHVIFAVLMYRRRALGQRLVFGPTSMTVPASYWSRDEKEIAYRDIQDISERMYRGVQSLYIKHSGGKEIIAEGMLPSGAAYMEIRALLIARVQ